MIRVRNLCRSFTSGNDTIRILQDLSFEIPDKTLTVLEGPSGSGKTTLINLLGALDRPDSGSILYGDRDICALDDGRRDDLRRRSIGFVFQSVALLPGMTARENIEFALRIAGVDPGRRRELSGRYLETVGLARRMDHFPAQLSGGEQQRVAIARAVAHRPEIIIADEPTAELDSHTGLQIIKLFVDLVENDGQTVIMATHDPRMTEVAGNVIDLSEGKS
jgi:putative ABC transport system ATP-binding protein